MEHLQVVEREGLSLTITAVELVLEDLAGVLLGLLRGVGVVEVGLVAAGNLGISRHVEWR